MTPALFAALQALVLATAGEPAPSWTWRGEVELPAMLANHVIGGIGAAGELERGALGVTAEAQLLPVVICDAHCGTAYEVGAGLVATPGRWWEATSHLALMVEFFDHPGLNQTMTALSVRAGARWLHRTSGVSLDATLSFARSSNFEVGGFARNKAFSWSMPGLIAGVWF